MIVNVFFWYWPTRVILDKGLLNGLLFFTVAHFYDLSLYLLCVKVSFDTKMSLIAFIEIFCIWYAVMLMSDMISLDTVVFLLQVEIIGRLSSRRQRDQYLSALLNGSPVIDIQLTEAAKVIVMLVAIDAHENFISGIEVASPVIVWQIFGRESSHSPERFFREHVNRVGDATILGEDKVRLFSVRQSISLYTLGLGLGLSPKNVHLFIFRITLPKINRSY